jgi:uncharacterized membrane-anchored protein YjiN (DUF445 family)
MTANQLADVLEHSDFLTVVFSQAAATMLRQQQAEYYSLVVNHDKLYAKVVEQQAEIEALKAKTLTDEEIRKVADEVFKDYKNWHHYQIDFARAILKKASEK